MLFTTWRRARLFLAPEFWRIQLHSVGDRFRRLRRDGSLCPRTARTARSGQRPPPASSCCRDHFAAQGNPVVGSGLRIGQAGLGSSADAVGGVHVRYEEARILFLEAARVQTLKHRVSASRGRSRFVAKLLAPCEPNQLERKTGSASSNTNETIRTTALAVTDSNTLGHKSRRSKSNPWQNRQKWQCPLGFRQCKERCQSQRTVGDHSAISTPARRRACFQSGGT